jgi:hypothetical protein
LALLSVMLIGIAEAQVPNAVIGLTNTFTSPDITCGNWCWARAIKNILPHYGSGNISELEILEYARERRLFNIPDSITCNYSCFFPNSCCCYTMDTDKILQILKSHGIYGAFSASVSSSTQLEENFLTNRPVLIQVTGHVFVAHGIQGYLVHIIDGTLGECTRPIYDIYPNRTWIGTGYFSHSPNCSAILVVGGISSNTGTIYLEATNRIEAKSSIPPGNNVYLISEGEVLLNPGFYVRETSSLEISTGTSTSCP